MVSRNGTQAIPDFTSYHCKYNDGEKSTTTFNFLATLRGFLGKCSSIIVDVSDNGDVWHAKRMYNKVEMTGLWELII